MFSANKLNDIQRRAMPDATCEFLRCQLGRFVMETRRHRFRSTGGQWVETTYMETLFHLLAFGPTWDEAELMLDNKMSPPAPVSPVPPLSEPDDYFSRIFALN